MIDNRIEPYEIVRTHTGERLIPPYMELWNDREWAILQDGLKKDGTPSYGRVSGRGFYVKSAQSRYGINYGDWVRYDPAKEVITNSIRAEIKQLEKEITDAKARLLGVYSDNS